MVCSPGWMRLHAFVSVNSREALRGLVGAQRKAGMSPARFQELGLLSGDQDELLEQTMRYTPSEQKRPFGDRPCANIGTINFPVFFCGHKADNGWRRVSFCCPVGD